MKFESNHLADWLAHIEALHAIPIDMGLDRMREMVKRLGITFKGQTTILVGGTNGKGSSCALLEHIYRAAGYTTGMHTSPHLMRVNERCVINGKEVSDERLIDAFREVEAARAEMTLSYFEYTGLAFLKIFQDEALDVVILEIGLGGRLDAMNVIDANAALIATVGIDHVAFLGNTREKIGWEKAHIYRQGAPAVLADPDTPESVREVAQQFGALKTFLNEDYRYTINADGTWNFTLGELSWTNLPPSNLVGRNQYQNAAGVLAVVARLLSRVPVTRDAIEKGLQTVRLAGRFEVVQKTPYPIVIDVGHNPQAASVLRRNILDTKRPGERTIAVFGMLADKDMQSVAGLLKDVFDVWYIASLTGPRAATAEQLAAAMVEAGVNETRIQRYDDVVSALTSARSDALKVCKCENSGREACEPVRMIIFGSFVTVTAAAEALAKDGIVM